MNFLFIKNLFLIALTKILFIEYGCKYLKNSIQKLEMITFFLKLFLGLKILILYSKY